MRAYTLALLSKLTADGKTVEDKDIVEWVNNKVQFALKQSRVVSKETLALHQLGSGAQKLGL